MMLAMMMYRPHVTYFVLVLIGLVGIADTGRAEPYPDSAYVGQSVSQSLRAASLVGVALPSPRGEKGGGASRRVFGVTQQRRRKSPLSAVLRSLGSTLVPAGAGLLMLQAERPMADWIGGVTLASGLIVGPAVGHFYASNEKQAWRGIAVRGAALVGGGLVTGLLIPFAVGRDYPYGGEDGSEIAGVAAIVTLLASGLVLSVRTLYDIARADDAAREHNARLGLTVRPQVHPIQRRGGLALRWTF